MNKTDLKLHAASTVYSTHIHILYSLYCELYRTYRWISSRTSTKYRKTYNTSPRLLL